MNSHLRSLIAPVLIVFTIGSASCSRSKDTPTLNTERLELASWGGSFQEALDLEVIKPIAKDLNLQAETKAYSGEYDRLAATIRDGTNPFDLVHVESVFLEQGERENLTEPIDYAVVDRKDFIEGATAARGVAVLAWSLVLSWNTSRLPAGNLPPSTWTDFFSLERYPGPRCLRKVPEGTLELALLADGVPADQIYTRGIDVERALRKLSTIKPQISWWSSGAELEQKLSAGCSLAAGWNGRVLNLRNTAGQPVDFTYEGAIHQFDWWIIPRNSQHKSAAMRFLAAFGKGQGQSAIGSQFGYGPVSRSVVDQLPNELLMKMPTAPANAGRGMRFDSRWWAENQGEVLSRWNEWLLDN